jgi:hypothetical protein
MRRRRRCQTRELTRAALFALALVMAGQARADCSFSDLASAITNVPSFVTSHSKCASLFANPAFWAVSSGVTLATMSSKEVKNACKEIEDLDPKVSGYQEKINAFYDKLKAWPDAQNAINDLPGANDIGSSSADLTEVLSFVSCACAMATESGPAQITEVAGSCLTAAICWLVTLGGSCGCPDQPPPVAVDCANFYWDPKQEIEVNQLEYDYFGTKILGDFGFNVDQSAGACSSGRMIDYCYCPKPMVLRYGQPGGTPGLVCTCPDNTHRPDKGHRDLADPVIARICLCDSTNELVNPDGSCPPPCDCGCKNNQIILAKDSNTCQCECGCPEGQLLVGESCVTPCADPAEILVANGSCCLPAQVSSCGTCCPLRSKPDAASGSCAYAPPPPPTEKLAPGLPKTP